MASKKPKFTITKELFIESIKALHEQFEHDKKCNAAFKVILPDDHAGFYDNHRITNQLIQLLQIATNDNHEHSWIEYYINELNFGKEYREDTVIKIKDENFKLQTPTDLWELLVEFDKTK